MNSGREKGGRTGIIIAAVCGVCFLGCLVWLIFYMINNNRAENDLDDLRQEYVSEVSGVVESQVTEPAAEPDATPAPTEEPSPLLGYDIPNKAVDIEALQESENGDIYAWIIVPGTVIDYPVLQHPEQLDYYLDHNVDNSKGYPGCIYSQNLNSKEWDDPNTVLYGHNMKNGSMFAGLHYYEDPEFLEENQYIYIFTQNYVRVYHIFGAYEYDNRHLLLAMDTTDPAAFAKYLVDVRNLKGIRDNFLEEVPVSIEDNVLTLETCIANKPDRRYIVQAVLEAEGEWPLEAGNGAQE
ncbi:MAG: class B sortase [Acetatifactor sp.]|nr:class B sortase [Acetatifactor sp.]